MSIIIRTDVSAIKLYKELILAGIGSYLHVYCKSSKKLLQKLICLKGQKIYGFIPSISSNNIIVFGGKQFTVISIRCEDLDNIFTILTETVTCEDWLHSAIWTSNDTIALLTAHNVVQIWNLTSKHHFVTSYDSRDNSILYSGLLLPLNDDVLVMAGTVFSEVIIHACKHDKPLHHLKGHRGVIFSISCNSDKQIILTTSDDRSVRIWNINHREYSMCPPNNTLEFWQEANIVCTHELYGHTARVMRSCITNDMVISVGEDSAICAWSYHGELLRKVTSHQNGGIWSLDADDDHIVTGGGDSGVILHPISAVKENGEKEILNITDDTPKKIVFTARRNIVVLDEDDNLIHYCAENKTKSTTKLRHESTYKLFCISPCKQMLAIADMSGNFDLFIENCKHEASLLNVINTKLSFGKILSMHWGSNRHIVLCCENGIINVLAPDGTNIGLFAEFVLPPCKERWLTAACVNFTNTILVVGDRCGNIHVYERGHSNSVKSFSKVHGRYGPTSITINESGFVTTGRDGTIKYFELAEQKMPLAKYMSKKDLEFQWVEKFVDKRENIICGFQERIFMVYNVKNNLKLLEVTCGGGHRSWDVVRYIQKINNKYEECIKFMYVKNSDIHIHTFHLSKIVSKNIVSGSHSSEINCLKAWRFDTIENMTFFITGGEDITLRVSSLDTELVFEDEIVFKHLSSVRSVQVKHLDDKRCILVSAGGRAQICIKLLDFVKHNERFNVKAEELIDYFVKGTEKERRGRQNWRDHSIDFDPETRIMDVDILEIHNDKFMIIAGCSDAYLRVYTYDLKNREIEPIKDLKHHKTCILKTRFIKFADKNIIVTCTTRGKVTFWDISDLDNVEKSSIKPYFDVTTNKSGINSFDYRVISENKLLFATGGDDNAIHLSLVKQINKCDNNSITICHSCSSDKLHCSQITGIILLDNIMVSTSIDQRISVCKWIVDVETVICGYLTQVYSDVADIHGMELIEDFSDSVTVCVFGKGMEIIKVPKPS